VGIDNSCRGGGWIPAFAGMTERAGMTYALGYFIQSLHQIGGEGGLEFYGFAC